MHKQLGEQLKSYDARTESKLSVLTDYQEFYKRLGEVELEYARNLDKVAERFQDKLRQKLQRYSRMIIDRFRLRMRASKTMWKWCQNRVAYPYMGTTRHFHIVFDVRVLYLNLPNDDDGGGIRW